MATRTESAYPEDWFQVALKDLKRVARCLEDEDVDDAAFHLQQAVEKALKGYLLARGWSLRRIHNVDALLADASEHDKSLKRYQQMCQRVAGYYIIERYPSFEEGPSLAEVQRAYQQAKQLISRLRSRRHGRRGG